MLKDTLEGKCHFQIYKRMHWVVCKTHREEIEKDFRVGLREEIYSSIVGTFPKKKWAQIPTKIFVSLLGRFFLLWEVVLYGSIQSVQVRVGTKIEVVFGTFFEADFKLLVDVSGPYGTIRTTDCGHGF
jgi:hypothetical protein